MRSAVKFSLRLPSQITPLRPVSPLPLSRREFRLEMKRGDRAQVQTEMVEFIVLPFSFSSKLKIWLFHVVVVKGQQRNVQKT